MSNAKIQSAIPVAALQSTQASPVLARVRSRGPIICFGIGAVIVLMTMFSPSIDQARVSARQVDLEIAYAEQKWTEESTGSSAKELAPASEEARANAPLNPTWLKQRHKLEQRSNDARLSAAGNAWWYQQQMRLGFLFLAIGSLGLTSPSQSTDRRVAGAIVLVAMLLLAFNSFAHFGIRFEIGPCSASD